MPKIYTPTTLADMRTQLSTFLDLAEFAECPEQKACLLKAAEVIEQTVRTHEKAID